MPALALHGGAGTILREEMTPEREEAFRDGIRRPLEEGWRMLAEGAAALDVVARVVALMEDDPRFNAGRGSVFTHEGKQEMDAAIMCGRRLDAGAVAGVSNVRNPIRLARAVLERSPHVLLVGHGALEFAREVDVELADDDWFFDQMRYEQLLRAREQDRIQLDHSSENPIGTVGCVALDERGDLAAATSTGGMTNKRHGRVGDTPIIGAGTWAANATCAVSCTGHGEHFIRGAIAHDLHALLEYRGWSLERAAGYLVHQRLRDLGGEGGLIAISPAGEIAMPFNSSGMYRGSVDAEGRVGVAIFQEDLGGGG